jgi:hypothetical protein
MGVTDRKANAPSTVALDVSYQTLILSLDLLGTELGNLPSLLTLAIQDLKFQQNVEDFLNGHAKQLLKQQNTSKALSASDATKIGLKSLQGEGHKTTDQFGVDIFKQIENRASFAALKAKLTELGKTPSDQPVGVWFNQSGGCRAIQRLSRSCTAELRPRSRGSDRQIPSRLEVVCSPIPSGVAAVMAERDLQREQCRYSVYLFFRPALHRVKINLSAHVLPELQSQATRKPKEILAIAFQEAL